MPILDSPHIAETDAAAVRYNSDPPTSGPHFAFTAPPGIYSAPLPDALAVHALEHGHIVIQYGPAVSAADTAKLDKIARRNLADVLLAPRNGLAADIALTAWSRIDRFSSVDEQRITGFIDALRGRYNHGWTTMDDCP